MAPEAQAPGPPEEFHLLSEYPFSAPQARILGAKRSGRGFTLAFFGRQFNISASGIAPLDNQPVTPAISDLLIRYLAGCPEQRPPDSSRLVTFRELSGGSPLFARVTANTAKTIETAYSGRCHDLAMRCRKLGGKCLDRPGYDLSVRFSALPRIPVFLSFNDQEEMMPAAALFLYQDTADRFLDLEGLMTICTYLTGMLIQEN